MRADILVLSEDVLLREHLDARLTRLGFVVDLRPPGAEVLVLLQGRAYDAIVLDLGADAVRLRFCEQLREVAGSASIVVLCHSDAPRDIVAAFRAGAQDLFTAPWDLDALAWALAGAARIRQAAEGASLRRELLGESPAIRRVRALSVQIADAEASVLILGENGTGKELLARVLHEQSARRARPFVGVPCATQAEATLERELFGHARGAFPGAAREAQGHLGRARGGTLFLDEVGALPMGLQGKLLRALQDRCFRPLGGAREEPFHARVVAASSRDLESLVAGGLFREDLFFYLGVIQIELPPLRERGEDVLLLGRRFLLHHAGLANKALTEISRDAAERLCAYRWPGNVRELRGCIERAVALCCGAAISLGDLPRRVLREVRGQPVGEGKFLPLEELERRHIQAVLEAAGGNKTAAAQILGLDRKTLYRKLERR